MGRGKILYVHFRDVQGTVPKFQESFIEEGNNDMAEVMLTSKQSGFTGFLIPDHVPHMVEDTPWGHRGAGVRDRLYEGLARGRG